MRSPPPLSVRLSSTVAKTCFVQQLGESFRSIGTAYSLLQTCTLKKDIGEGLRLHHALVGFGLDSISFWTDHLIRLFVSCGRLSDADRVFCRVLKPSLYTWNAIISAHVQLGYSHSVFRLYVLVIQECRLEPDRVMLLSLLKCCGSDVPQIRQVHHHIVSHGLDADFILSSALVDVNAKSGSLWDAFEVFQSLQTKDVVSWAALMTGYILHGFYASALTLFEDMRLEAVKPDRVVFLCVLKACSHIGSITLGWLLHDEILRDGSDGDSTVINTLIDMYGKCGSLCEAGKILHGFQKRDAVSWSALISGCIQHGYDALVFEYLQKMIEEGTTPSKVTFLCALKASINLVAVAQGWFLHDQIIRHGLQSDLEIGNCLIDLYAKFRMPNEAHRLFLHLPKQDLIAWGTLVAAYAQIGEFDLVLHLLRDMNRRRLKPNDIIFTSIFAACSCAGLIQEAQKYFKVMIEEFGISPNIQHYSCLIDLFGRSGLLEEAEQFFEIMPLPPDAIAWKSLLNNCKTHGSLHLGHLSFDRGIEMDPEDATNYELLAGIYADAKVG